jgi:hypothetical protein
VFATQPTGKHVAVLYTASVQGYVEPCGCTGDPLGGVARLSALVDDAHAAYGDRVVLLDAGDLLFEKLEDTAAADVCQASARDDLLVSTYARKGLVATVLGPLDDVRGTSFRDGRMARAQIPTLGVPDAGRALVDGAVHQTSIVREAGGVRVGITGFRADDTARADVVRPALQAELAKLRAQHVDIVIALAQAPRGLVRKIVDGMSGLDVVIQGRAPGETPTEPERVGESGPVIVASGNQAQHMGVLELHLDGRVENAPLALDDRGAERTRRASLLDVRIHELTAQTQDMPDSPRKQFLVDKLKSASDEKATFTKTLPPLQGPHILARAVPLSRGAPEEATAKQALDAYQAQIPVLVSTCESGMTCASPAPDAPTYVGAATCKACHATQFAFWQEQRVQLPGKDKAGGDVMRNIGHSKAWETLTSNHKDKDRGCVACHSTGFAAPGGACKTSDVVTQHLEGVQCEACHGPGSLHAKSGAPALIKRRVDEATCRTCHQPPHIPTTESFVMNERLKLILGKGHGEQRRSELAP